MNTKYFSSYLLIAIVTFFLGMYTLSAHADAFSDYVNACKKDLGISKIPQFGCKDINFRHPENVPDQGLDFSQSNDYVAHRVINDSVDAVFACRWVEQNNNPGRAVGGEMIVHNRRNGATCFFDMKDTGENAAYPEVNINPLSPTDSNAGTVWKSETFCTQCHAAGAYIASPEIVGALQTFGLINDGHDVFNQRYHYAGGQPIQNATANGCNGQCHSIGGNPEVNSIIGAGLVFGSVVMPSINFVINEVEAPPAAMKPDDPYSDYRWMNHDRASGSGDWELLSDEADQFYGIYSTCESPVILQAHAVDSSDVITTDLPDNLHTFNLRDGLECRNNQQSSGQCHDWKLRYMCNGKWTDWINNDTPNKNGDYERRTDPGYANLCSSPTEMQAETDVESWGIIGQAGFPPVPLYGPIFNTAIFTAPNDRLEAFDPSYGLACVNSDQPDGKCSNYVVRFICQN